MKHLKLALWVSLSIANRALLAGFDLVSDYAAQKVCGQVAEDVRTAQFDDEFTWGES